MSLLELIMKHRNVLIETLESRVSTSTHYKMEHMALVCALENNSEHHVHESLSNKEYFDKPFLSAIYCADLNFLHKTELLEAYDEWAHSN